MGTGNQGIYLHDWHNGAEMLGSLRERTGLTISKIYDYEPLRR